MSASNEDRAGTKMARSLMARRGLDIALADVRVSHGVCYIRGTVKVSPGNHGDVETEVNHIAKSLRSKAEIRDVIVEITTR